MDLYGELLTDRQREFMELHYAEDLSFGEIGEQFEVSRQAIHDAVKHGVDSLENYEQKMKLLVRFPHLFGEDKNTSTPENPAQNPSTPVNSTSEANTMGAEPLNQLRRVIAELKASGGVVYNAVEIATTLEAVEATFSKALKG